MSIPRNFSILAENANSSGVLQIAGGGTGTTTPSLVAGTNVTITGTWPNQTINSTGSGGSGVSSVTASSPLASSGGTTPNISFTGTLAVANGGTGAATLTGYVYGNGTSAMTASTTIPTTALSGTITNAQLANSSLTVNGTAISLGGSGTVTAAAGTLTGTTLNSTVTGSSLTSVGTITSGTWNGGIIPVAYGGTGTSSPGLIQGANITISGSWPNQTIAATGSTGVSSVTASSPLASSGGSTPNISFSGILGISNGGTGTASPALVNGTNTSVSGTWPAQAVNITAFPASSLTGTISLTTQVSGTLPVANGGTGVTTSSGASSVVLRDSSANITTNALFEGYTNQAAGTAITLTASSTPNWIITGSGGQTITLPNATTLPIGAQFTFNNNQTSGTITVNNTTSTLVVSVASGAFATVTLLSNGSSAGTWDLHFSVPSNTQWSTNTFQYPGTITQATWNGVGIGTYYGGTGLSGSTPFTSGGAVYASSSSALTTGTLPVASGGTGATTLTGYLIGNGTSAVTASTTIPTSALSGTISNTQLANSSVTVNGTAISLGGSGTVTAAAGTLTGITLNSTVTGSSLTSVGTITSGTWNGTTIAIANGGTGQTSKSAAFNALSPITATGDLIIGNGTNSATNLAIGANTYVLTSNGTTASWAAPTGGASLSANNTWTGTQTFSGTSSVLAATFANMAENITVSATAATGTINLYTATQSILYYTTNATGNFTINVAHSSGTTLNTAMATGTAITVVFMNTNGTTAYYCSAMNIDGTAQTVKWLGNIAPAAGNPSLIDFYTFTIIKTGSATYTVFGSMTTY